MFNLHDNKVLANHAFFAIQRTTDNGEFLGNLFKMNTLQRDHHMRFVRHCHHSKKIDDEVLGWFLDSMGQSLEEYNSRTNTTKVLVTIFLLHLQGT